MIFTRPARLLVTLVLALFLTSAVLAQGNNGRGSCMQSFGISFYKVKGGHEDEWLDLYMKWHYPLLEYALQHGTLVEQRLFVPDGHAQNSEWTFASSFLFPAAQQGARAPLGRAELIQELFGKNMDDYVAGEKRRWEITEAHWDTDFVELDKSETPLSVYLPSAGGCDQP